MERHRTSLSAQAIQLYIQLLLKLKHLQILKISRFLYYDKQIFLHEPIFLFVEKIHEPI